MIRSDDGADLGRYIAKNIGDFGFEGGQNMMALTSGVIRVHLSSTYNVQYIFYRDVNVTDRIRTDIKTDISLAAQSALQDRYHEEIKCLTTSSDK